MNHSRRNWLAAGAAALLSVAIAAPALAQATWKPTKPITIIVPWAAGGSTDLHLRQFAHAIFQRVGGLVDALDAFQPPFQLQLVFAHLGFQGGHDGTQPVVDVPIDQFECAPDLRRGMLSSTASATAPAGG